MQGLYTFLIEPIGQRYDNIKKVEGKDLIINTEISNHQYVNRKAKVISTPKLINTSIRAGDEVIVHHNVFRRWLNVRGEEKNSKAYFQDNKYVVSLDQIFLYKSGNEVKPVDGFSFVQPLINQDEYSDDQEHQTKGVIVYNSGSFNKGDVVGYTPFSQYEFIIDNQRLYRVYNKFITIKYEREGNEKTYNPSWA